MRQAWRYIIRTWKTRYFSSKGHNWTSSRKLNKSLRLAVVLQTVWSFFSGKILAGWRDGSVIRCRRPHKLFPSSTMETLFHSRTTGGIICLLLGFIKSVSAGLSAVTLFFRTGSAFTMPPGRIPVADGTLYDGWYYDYSTRNNSRQESYHRLDVSFSYKKQRTIFGRNYESEWVFGVYNIYNRKNPYFVYVTIDSQQVPRAKQVSLLPIVPSVSYNFKF